MYMSEEIMKKLTEHDEHFEKIDEHFEKIDERFEKIDEHFEKIDERFEKIDERFVRVDERFDRLEKQVDLIAIKVVEHDEQFRSIKENMATKDDIREIAMTLDIIVGLQRKRDQEMSMIVHGMKRHEGRIEKLETEAKRLNPAFGLG